MNDWLAPSRIIYVGDSESIHHRRFLDALNLYYQVDALFIDELFNDSSQFRSHTYQCAIASPLTTPLSFLRNINSRIRIGICLAYEINNEEYWKSNFDVIRKEILSLSGIITDSFFIKERIYEIFGFRNPIKVIPYGCQTQVFSPASNCQDSAETNILIARKWEPIYNNGLILEALSGMQPQFEFKLRIANGGSLLEDAKQKYQNLTEVGLFTFLGELNPVQLANELAQADVYISAARNDGISVTLLEAMSSGCISIAADFPSVFEVIQDGQNGFLFRHGDLGSLRGTIEKVFGLSEIERENIRQKARKTILASFDWEKNKESFVAFVRELIGG